MRQSKYGAKKVIIDGITFDSKKEARRYFELTLLEKAREISGLELQVKFELEGADGRVLVSDSGRRLSYVADFTYRDQSGALIIEDAKGMETPAYKLKKAIMRSMGHQIIET
jgi:hypothetical protein